MALSVYLRANAAEKVVNSFSQRGEFDKMVAYASKVGNRGRGVDIVKLGNACARDGDKEL